MIDLAKSGLEDDSKTWTEQAKEYWSVGYTTGEKKLEMLKQAGKSAF